jgi:kinesin family member C1
VEIETRRNAVQLSDEIDSLRLKHRREVMELELDKSRQEREIKSLKNEIELNEEELRKERQGNSTLKVTNSHS